MRGGTLGRRYAKALLGLATDQGKLDEVGRHLRTLADAWELSDELRSVFENPSFGAETRRSILEALTAHIGAPTVVTSTLRLLSDRRRMRHLPEVADAYEDLAEEKSGRIRAEVVTAQTMTDAYYGQLQTALERVTGKKVVLIRREDPSLIGGVIARVGDRVFDGSIKHRLAQIRDGLLSH